MGRIHLLDEATANGIAAGEVVERPSSVVKELVENAVDAGATTVTVEIDGGGITLIRVTDDGCGMEEDDARMAFQIHATSKLQTLEDLFTLHTMGFRGEALASISAVSRVRLQTCRHGDDFGTQVEIEAGRFVNMSRVGGPAGTRVEVRDLFFNLPARYKFLKKDQTEAQYVIQLMERFALIRPDVSFRMINHGKEMMNTPGNGDKVSALYSIYGKKIVDACLPMTSAFGELNVDGFVGRPEIARNSRSEQTIFVNDRLVKSRVITSAIDEAYRTMLMKGKYPFIILSIFVPSHLIDVNVHPQKSEVRFWNDGEVFRAVFHSIQNTLLSSTHVAEPEVMKAFTPVDLLEKKGGVERSEANIVLPSTDSTVNSLPNRPSYVPQPAVTLPEKPSITYPVQTNLSLSITEQGTGSVHKKAESSLERDEDDAYRTRFGFSVTDLAESRVIGTLFSTYILLEHKDQLILIDQHAAHEKILFEELTRKMAREDQKLPVQTLLLPEIIRLSSSEVVILEGHSEEFERLGFAFEWLGNKEIILREVPGISVKYSPQNAFRAILDTLAGEKRHDTDKDLIRVLATAACKAAVKGHDHLDDIEIQALMDQLVLLQNPYHCPHGRPIMIRMTRKDLEKEFKRII